MRVQGKVRLSTSAATGTANRRVAVIVHQKAKAKVKKDISSVENGEENGNFPSLPGGSIHSSVDVAVLQTWWSSSNKKRK